MKKKKIMAGFIGMVMILTASWSAAADLADIVLPVPRTEGGMPLMQALKLRHSDRSYSPEPLPVQVVADLLWAACGINRPESGKRTAPSARNWQEVDVYAITADGAYRYDAGANRLKMTVQGDLRKLTGRQPFPAKAPLNLVYVADLNRMTGASEESQQLYSATDVGFVSQNVYLFCASEGLATVVRGAVDREPLAKALNLGDHQKIILCQTVGYPGNK